MIDIPSYILGKKSGGSSQSEDYSTTEKRIGTWIDGKPLYQKCFTGTLTSTQREITIPESDISSNLDKICYLGGIVDKRGVSGHPIPYWKGSDDYANVFIAGNAKNILVEGGSQHGYGDFVLTVKYTKTTD